MGEDAPLKGAFLVHVCLVNNQPACSSLRLPHSAAGALQQRHQQQRSRVLSPPTLWDHLHRRLLQWLRQKRKRPRRIKAKNKMSMTRIPPPPPYPPHSPPRYEPEDVNMTAI